MKKIDSEPFLHSRVALVKAEKAKVEEGSPLKTDTPVALAIASILVPARSSNVTSTKPSARATEPKEGTRLLAWRRAGKKKKEREEEGRTHKTKERGISSKMAEEKTHR